MWFPSIQYYTSKFFQHFNRIICFPIITVVYCIWYSLKEAWLWPVLFLNSLTRNDTPLTSSSPSDLSNPTKWINPCGIQWPQNYNDFNTPPPRAIDTSKNILELEKAVKIARENAVDFKNEFLSSQLLGTQKKENVDAIKTLEDSISEYREEWLPKIPDLTEPILKLFWSTSSTTLKLKGYQMFFKYLQYFAVGFEQIISDQVRYNGKYIQKFKQIEQDLIQLLCLLQIEMYLYKTLPTGNIAREVMTNEYRNVRVKSSRDLRDYFILRDYIKLTELVIRLFNCMEKRENC